MIVLNLLEKASGVHSSQVLMFKSLMHLSYEFILANENTDNSMFCSLIKLQLHVLMATSGFPIFSLCRKKLASAQYFWQIQTTTCSNMIELLFLLHCFDAENLIVPAALPKHFCTLLDCCQVTRRATLRPSIRNRPHSSFKLDKIKMSSANQW